MPFKSSTYSAESLPLAVWAAIFSYLKPDCGNVTSRAQGSINEESYQSAVMAVAASQSQYLHLKLVCRTFNQVFKMEQSLSDQPVLAQADPAMSMPSFQIWLKQYSGSVEKVVSMCNEAQQDMFFGVLSLSTNLYCWQPSVFALDSLSTLTSVTHCKLVGSQDRSLMALKALTSLELLALEDGSVCDVPVAKSLKHLHIMSSDVQCAEGISHPQNLQTLGVVDSLLSGLHDMGLVACTALHSLIFGMCLIQAAEPAHALRSSFFAGAFAVPAVLSSLKHLAVLKALLVSKDGTGLSTDWLYSLTSLQRVALTFSGSASLSAELTQLTNLVFFKVTTKGRAIGLIFHQMEGNAKAAKP